MDITSLIIQAVSGAVGGNVAGAAMKENSLGTLGNSIAGIVGGGLGGTILQAILGSAAAGGGGLDLTTILTNVAGGGVGEPSSWPSSASSRTRWRQSSEADDRKSRKKVWPVVNRKPDRDAFHEPISPMAEGNPGSDGYGTSPIDKPESFFHNGVMGYWGTSVIMGFISLLASCDTRESISSGNAPPAEQNRVAQPDARPDLKQQQLAFLNRIRDADPQQRTIERAMLNEQNELGLILDGNVGMDRIPDLMRMMLTEMAREFPNQDLTVLAYTPSNPPRKIGTAHLDARTRAMSYVPEQ